MFEVGDSFFTQNWVTAPASTDARDGLGPLFNAQSCSSCHLRDGRGTADGDEPGLLFRLSRPRSTLPSPTPRTGDQIQDRSILGVPPKARSAPSTPKRPGPIPTGPRIASVALCTSSRTSPTGDSRSRRDGVPPAGATGVRRRSPRGDPEGDILAAADPDDADDDGISGRPNHVRRLPVSLGRFGWKANVPTVDQQVAVGLRRGHRDHLPRLPRGELHPDPGRVRRDMAGHPRSRQDLFDQVVFYNRDAGGAARRNLDDPDVDAGASLFEESRLCLVPPAPPGHRLVRHRSARRPGDLSVHRPAPPRHGTGSRRRPSRWGSHRLGVADPAAMGYRVDRDVNGNFNFLHDGRARSLEEAILWHGGEASHRNRHSSLSARSNARS